MDIRKHRSYFKSGVLREREDTNKEAYQEYSSAQLRKVEETTLAIADANKAKADEEQRLKDEQNASELSAAMRILNKRNHVKGNKEMAKEIIIGGSKKTGSKSIVIKSSGSKTPVIKSTPKETSVEDIAKESIEINGSLTLSSKEIEDKLNESFGNEPGTSLEDIGKKEEPEEEVEVVKEEGPEEDDEEEVEVVKEEPEDDKEVVSEEDKQLEEAITKAITTDPNPIAFTITKTEDILEVSLENANVLKDVVTTCSEILNSYDSTGSTDRSLAKELYGIINKTTRYPVLATILEDLLDSTLSYQEAATLMVVVISQINNLGL